MSKMTIFQTLLHFPQVVGFCHQHSNCKYGGIYEIKHFETTVTATVNYRPLTQA